MYQVRDDQDHEGDIRYAIWSECIRCHHCRAETALSESSVCLDPAEISSDFQCRR